MKKWVLNNIVVVGIGLPNLMINLGVQAVLDVAFKWSGFWALLAYLIGTAVSVQYSVIFSVLTKSRFRAFGKEYRY